jgi:CheY-like chemotaxis protein
MARKARVLVVDDDRDLGEMLKRMLAQDGIDTQFSDNPLKASRLLRQEHYDVLLTDMNMPFVSGIELIMWAKKHAPRTQSIMMTAMPIEAIKPMADQAGVLDIFRKPLNLIDVRQQLAERIKTGLSGKVRQVNLGHLLQIMLMDKVNRKIFIQDKSTGNTGTLLLFGGDLVHASITAKDADTPMAEGDAAFYALLKIKNGAFTEQTYNPLLPHNVQTPFQSLMMEAAKQTDENDDQELQVENPYLQNIDKIRRIMVVDDDMIIRILLNKSLTQQGYEVIDMPSAVDAVDYLEAYKNSDEALPLDLIITDVSMPGMSGIEFLLWLKEHRFSLPVIMMTAFHSKEVEQTARQNKVLRYLNKPVKLKELEILLGEVGNTGLEGYVDNINIFDFIQLSLMSGERNRIQVKDQENGQSGFLYLNQGDILHAEYQGQTGEAAFYALISIGKGMFFEREWQTPPVQSLQDTPVHKLLIGATRLLDRQNAFWPGSESMLEAIEQKVDTGISQLPE